MNKGAILLAATAMLALTACERFGLGGGGAGNNSAGMVGPVNNAGNTAQGNQTGGADTGKPTGGDAAPGQDTAGPAPETASGTVRLDRAYVMGRWTDDGNCANAIEMHSDGRFTAANGNQGLWNLDGDRLTMQGTSAITLRVVPIDQNVMNLVNPDQSLGRSTRC